MLTNEEVRNLCFNYLDSQKGKGMTHVELFLGINEIIREAIETNNNSIFRGVEVALTDYTAEDKKCNSFIQH